MAAESVEYMETSGPIGMSLVLIGLAVLVTNYMIGVFTTWTWALLIAGTWVALGSLLLYPDVRLYQYDQSPLEQLVLDDSTE